MLVRGPLGSGTAPRLMATPTESATVFMPQIYRKGSAGVPSAESPQCVRGRKHNCQVCAAGARECDMAGVLRHECGLGRLRLSSATHP